MGGLKTLALCGLCLIATPVPGRAMDDLPRLFANCAGQYSALMEHAWLLSDARADEYERQRDGFLSLLDAVGAADDLALARRIDAKAAMSQLLGVATFADDRVRAERAARNVRGQVDSCRLMLLGG